MGMGLHLAQGYCEVNASEFMKVALVDTKWLFGINTKSPVNFKACMMSMSESSSSRAGLTLISPLYSAVCMA